MGETTAGETPTQAGPGADPSRPRGGGGMAELWADVTEAVADLRPVGAPVGGGAGRRRS